MELEKWSITRGFGNSILTGKTKRLFTKWSLTEVVAKGES